MIWNGRKGQGSRWCIQTHQKKTNVLEDIARIVITTPKAVPVAAKGFLLHHKLAGLNCLDDSVPDDCCCHLLCQNTTRPE